MDRALGELVEKLDGTGPLTGCPIAEFAGGKNNKPKGACHEG